MNVNEIAKNFTGQNGLAYGIDTAIKALRPGAKFEMSAGGGTFNFPKWSDPNGKPPPTKDQIMAEFGATLRAGFGGKAQKKPTSAPKPAPTAIAPPPRKLPVTEPQFTAAMAWDACRKNVPTGAQEKWSETLDSIFGSKPEADFTSADWKRVADHFEVGGDDVPF